MSRLPKVFEVPVLPIRNAVVFPVLAFPINVGRKYSIGAVEEASERNNLLAIFTQKNPTEVPEEDDLYEVGSVVRIIKKTKMPENKLSIVYQGLSRIRLKSITNTGTALMATVERIDDESDEDLTDECKEIRELAQKVFELSPTVSNDTSFLVRQTEDPDRLADIIIINLNIENEEKQELLETIDVRERLQKVHTLLQKEINILELSNKLQTTVRGEMDKAQREYFLREQKKAIERELGESDDRQDDFDDLKKKIKKALMPEDAEKVAIKELKRMSKMNPSSAEYTVSRTYLDWLVELPWSISTEDILDIQRAAEILDEDHFGLEKVKKRILEFLAVRKLKNDMKGPILCLLGPPGVGKTSLAKSVARAMDRKLIRLSLGGVRDESEIRGHRRTYIGSMPGKVIKGMKKAGSNNPVCVLDEIDKMGADHRGDPSSAMLEVLDPEQNDTFNDHYLDLPFDLSKVLFIATANMAAPIPGPLRDRMEIIELSGYTMDEKVSIAQQYIIPEQMRDHGISDEYVEFPEEGLRFLIESYTREAGVRSLKREVAALCRSVAKDVASEILDGRVSMTSEKVEAIRGPIRYFNDVAQRTSVSGVATGLAWTAVGGDILFIEATKMKGKGGVQLSGSLGDVMKESVGVARSFVRSSAIELGIDEDLFSNTDIHIHVPSGAIPKDGPSAGVTMLTALVSLLTDIKVDSHLAMTGEATLRGAVLPVGGIKEKVLAAHRAGITKVILPEKNRKDLPDIPEEIQKDLEIHFCAKMSEVLEIALGEDLKKHKEAFLAKKNVVDLKKETVES